MTAIIGLYSFILFVGSMSVVKSHLEISWWNHTTKGWESISNCTFEKSGITDDVFLDFKTTDKNDFKCLCGVKDDKPYLFVNNEDDYQRVPFDTIDEQLEGRYDVYFTLSPYNNGDRVQYTYRSTTYSRLLAPGSYRLFQLITGLGSYGLATIECRKKRINASSVYSYTPDKLAANKGIDDNGPGTRVTSTSTNPASTVTRSTATRTTGTGTTHGVSWTTGMLFALLVVSLFIIGAYCCYKHRKGPNNDAGVIDNHDVSSIYDGIHDRDINYTTTQLQTLNAVLPSDNYTPLDNVESERDVLYNDLDAMDNYELMPRDRGIPFTDHGKAEDQYEQISGAYAVKNLVAVPMNNAKIINVYSDRHESDVPSMEIRKNEQTGDQIINGSVESLSNIVCLNHGVSAGSPESPKNEYLVLVHNELNICKPENKI